MCVALFHNNNLSRFIHSNIMPGVNGNIISDTRLHENTFKIYLVVLNGCCNQYGFAFGQHKYFICMLMQIEPLKDRYGK